MTPPVWDPERYLQYADQRGRPFLDLIARIGATDPQTVVDLGCGPGNLTSLLADRWPAATVVGIDSSPEMIAAAADPRIDFAVQDLRGWVATADPVDVIVSNATLQWVPGHLDLIGAMAALVRPGGWLAIQVPGNHDAPSHTILADLAGRAPYRRHTGGAARPASHYPEQYWRALTAAGLQVDAWETTYLHELTGPDPVFTWISGTGARPVLQALPPDLREEFVAEFKRRLAEAYPARDGVVLLEFRRVFAVGHR